MSPQRHSNLYRDTSDSLNLKVLTEQWSGVQVAHYTIKRCVRAGKYHALFEAFSGKQAEKRIAVKIPLEHDLGERLIRERLVLEELEGTNLAPSYVLHGHCQENKPLLAMEWIEGTSLEQRLRLSPSLSKHDYFDYMLQLAHGLAEIHERGYAVLNLSIYNIRIEHGRVRLVDLGEAFHVREPRHPEQCDPRKVDIALLGELMKVTLGSQGRTEAKFFCGAAVSQQIFALIEQCTQEDAYARPNMLEVGQLLSQLLAQGDQEDATPHQASEWTRNDTFGSITDGLYTSSATLSPSSSGFDQRDATRLNKKSVSESVELLRQTYEEPTRPKLKTSPLLNAEAREKLRKRFMSHLEKSKEE